LKHAIACVLASESFWTVVEHWNHKLDILLYQIVGPMGTLEAGSQPDPNGFHDPVLVMPKMSLLRRLVCSFFASLSLGGSVG
jgi:hypothetical protein